MFRSTLIVALLLTNIGTFAQTTAPGLGSWTVLTLRGKIKSNIYYLFETQARSNRFYNQFFYHEFKGGLGVNVNKRFSLFIGSGKYDTYTPGGNFKRPATANEVRVWQEAIIKDNIGRVFLENRFRIEQRFFTTGYRNRFRYRLGIAVPINNKKMETKTFYLSTFNELFLTNTEPYFERNRFFLGCGYRILPLTIQAGWINQLDYRLTTGGVAKNFVQLTFSIEIGGKKEDPARLPFGED